MHMPKFACLQLLKSWQILEFGYNTENDGVDKADATQHINFLSLQEQKSEQNVEL